MLEVAGTKARAWRTAFYGLLIASFLLLVLVAIRFLAVEVDESEILLNVAQLAGGPVAGKGLLFVPILTNGGLYAAIHYPLLLAGLSIDAHRLASFVFLGLTLILVYRIVCAQGVASWVGLFAVVVFVTVPGLLLQAGLSMAEIMATFSALAAAWYWTERGCATLVGSLLTGLLLGVACATRTSTLPFLPAFLVWGVLYARALPGVLLRSLVVCGVAGLVFAVGLALIYLLFQPAGAKSFAGAVDLFRFATGADDTHQFHSREFLAHFMHSEELFPAAILSVSALALASGLPAGALAGARSLCVLLFWAGLIGWAAWIFRTPIPHVRYLYPALPAVWLAGTILLSDWLTALQPGRARSLLEAAVLSVFATQFAISARQVAFGETLNIVFESVGVIPIKDYFPPWQARADQANFATLLGNLPDANICVLFYGSAYPFYWLTNYKVTLLPLWDEAGYKSKRCDYLALLPPDQYLWPPTSDTADWIRYHATVTAEVGGYILYKISDNAPAPPPL